MRNAARRLAALGASHVGVGIAALRLDAELHDLLHRSTPSVDVCPFLGNGSDRGACTGRCRGTNVQVLGVDRSEPYRSLLSSRQPAMRVLELVLV